MTDPQKEYQLLFSLSKKIRLIDSISYLLEWDQETYMPPKGCDIRAAQIECMASLSHKKRTSKKYEQALSKLIDLEVGTIRIEGLSELQEVALKEWRRDFLKAIALPNAFVKSFAKLTSKAMTLWSQARKKNTFSDFSPYLKKIVEKCREKAELLGYKEHPYDALLDNFEPNITTTQITQLFNKLKKEILVLLKRIQSQPQVDDLCLHGKFSADKQLKFGNMLLQAMGYDLEKGRLDLSNHPFSMSLHPSDSRVTTRIHRTSIFDSLSSVLHEGGHSLYEMGLIPEYYGSPLCEPISLGMHESQSRFWETCIGQSKPFWQHFLPLLKKEFKQLNATSLEQFYYAINKVSPTFIRVEADEITYSLHVILRFELEKQLIEGSLKVDEIPELWNQKMQDFLGIIPENANEGCLQDIHWSMGAFGYFPTYTLGNVYASHIFEAFEKEFPSWKEQVAQGELIFIKEWLNKTIHRHGRFYNSQELIEKISGKKVSEEPYLKYLTTKYSEIYLF